MLSLAYYDTQKNCEAVSRKVQNERDTSLLGGLVLDHNVAVSYQ